MATIAPAATKDRPDSSKATSAAGPATPAKPRPPEQRSLLSELTVAVLSKETHSRSESFRQLRMALTAALTSTSARGSRDLNG